LAKYSFVLVKGRDMNTIRKLCLGLLCVSFLLSTAVSAKFTDDYPQDMIKKYPKTISAYKKLMPQKWAKIDWVYSLNGVAGIVHPITIEGKKFFWGHVCKPHDCADNGVSYLLSADGSTGYALVNSIELTQGKELVLGNPGEAQLKILKSEDY
jgi:hypothetical protein